MIRRHIIIGATLATFALASCGGDDDPSPTPTPTGTPTPTPTASPTYTAFPLSTAVQFGAISATTSYTGDPATGAITLGVAGTEIATGRVTLATSSLIDTATYVININNEESRFVKANLTTAPAATVPEFIFRTNDTATAGKFAQLEFLNNTIPATTGTTYAPTDDAGLKLLNTSYATWWRGDSTTGAKRVTYTVFGYPTVATDLPTTGTVNYNARVTGRIASVAGATSVVDKVTGTATLSVNYATGQVNLSMALNQGATSLGTLTGQGAISVGSIQFTGAFGSGSALDGTFAGGFFGSQAKEVGITFAASGTSGGADRRIVGTVIAMKP
jgi:hypothetical protein